MKNYLFIVILILTGSFYAKADSWALPTPKTYCSENKKYCLKVEPKKLESQLSYFEDKVNDKEDAGADKTVKDNYCKGIFSAKGKKLWKIQLDNEVSPVSALVSNDGDYVITFDNWHGIGYGDNVVAIYDGSTGKLVKKLALTDFLTKSDIYNLPASTSSIDWHGTDLIDYGKKQLVLKVVKPGKEENYFDVHLDLTNGAVLDEVVDRLPSLQFILSSKDQESEQTNPAFMVKEADKKCVSGEEVAQISIADMNKRIVRQTFPQYPAAAEAVRAVGDSVFEVTVAENGTVECINPVSGHVLLRAALLNAIKTWEFEKSPTKYKGKIIIEGKSVLVLNGKVVG